MAAESIAIDVPNIPSLQQRLEALQGYTPTFTMFRVPAHIRDSRKMHYEPRIVSIGPYHHGRDNLQAMEEHKMLYLRDFMSRSSNSFATYLHKIVELLPRARSCYFESVNQLDDQLYAEMLLLDGCFILEFLFKYIASRPMLQNVGWLFPLARNDLLLLENQIPFFVLRTLFDHLVASVSSASSGYGANSVEDSSSDDESARSGAQCSSLVDMLDQYTSLVNMFADYLTKRKGVNVSVAHGEIQHLLHLYHHCFVDCAKPSQKLSSKKKHKTKAQGEARTPRTIPSATQLQEASVKFKRKTSRNNPFDITFERGILEIPFLSIEDSTRSRMMNLVAFEQCIPVSKRIMSSYAGFMDCIIDTPKDVAILRQYGILENKLTSDEEAALFFNQLADCAIIAHEKHYLAGLYREVNRYCISNWHKWRARLMRDYFSNPWAIISVIAAVILLIFTFLQTFFTIYSSFRHP